MNWTLPAPSNRSGEESELFERLIAAPRWKVDDLFGAPGSRQPIDDADHSRFLPLLTCLAFGESSSLYGIARRFMSASIDVQGWLAMHLADEVRHTEAFVVCLSRLQPAARGRIALQSENRAVVHLVKAAHDARSLEEWLICTDVIETYGKRCYMQLASAEGLEPTGREFMRALVRDEAIHLAYIRFLLDQRRRRRTWSTRLRNVIVGIRGLASEVVQGRLRGCFELAGIEPRRLTDEIAEELATAHGI